MVSWQEEFHRILKDYYGAQRKRNPRFSVRAFAAHLKIAPSSASSLLRDDVNWKISANWALEVLERVNLKKTEKKRILALMGFKPNPDKQLLAEIPATALEHWAYWPILCCFDVARLNSSIPQISEKLGVSKKEVTTIVEDLLKRKFLVESKEGLLKRPHEYLASTDDISSEMIRALHQENLKQAARALQQMSFENREFQTLTFAGSKKTLEKAKEEIRDFVDRLAHIFNGDTQNDEIFRLSVQLFPMGVQKTDV